MYQAIGILELKSIARGIEACDTALKSAGIRLISSHPSCPGKYEMILTGTVSNVSAALDAVSARFSDVIIDKSLMGRIDERVISALFGTQPPATRGALGVVETYSAASAIKCADTAVKSARVELFDVRISRGMGGKGIVLLTGEIGDVSAAVEAAAAYARAHGQLNATSVIAAPHEELWAQM